MKELSLTDREELQELSQNAANINHILVKNIPNFIDRINNGRYVLQLTVVNDLITGSNFNLRGELAVKTLEFIEKLLLKRSEEVLTDITNYSK